MSRIGKFVETVSRLVVARDWKEKGMGSNSLMDIRFPFGVIKCSETGLW